MLARTHKMYAVLAEAEACTGGYALEHHDRCLEDHCRSAAPIGKFPVVEHESDVGRITMILIPENLGW